MIRERRKRRSNGLFPRASSAASADEHAQEEVPDVERVLAADPDYLTSMERVLAVTESFQARLDEEQRHVWLDLEEAILTHLTLVQQRVYVAGRDAGREQMRREVRDRLLDVLGHVLASDRPAP